MQVPGHPEALHLMKITFPAAAGIAFALAPLMDAEIIQKTSTFIITEPDKAKTEYGIEFHDPSQIINEIDMGVSTAVREYTGQIVASYRFDSNTLEFESFTFSNNNLDSEFQIYTREAPQSPPPVPLPPSQNYMLELFARVDYPAPVFGTTYVLSQANSIAGQVIRFRPETIVPIGGITGSGSLDNSQHVLFTYTGDMFTRHVVDSSAQVPLTVNYLTSPQDLPMRGTFTPSISVVASFPTYRRALAVLSIELDEQIPFTLQGFAPSLDLALDETEVGSFSANTVIFTIPTAYGEWADENGLTDPAPEDTNDSGIAYGILFALDLPATATALPITTELTESGPIVRIDLPETGLLNQMSIDYSTSLTDGDWPPLPTDYYLGGADSLDLGKTGSPAFGFPPGEIGFVRFVTIVE